MTSPRRFEQDLPVLLADLYPAGVPGYRDDIVQQTARMRQRPAWAFPGRWIPMVDLIAERRLAPRVPWRAIGVAALIALLIAGALVFVGSPRRVPAPFGPAGDGLIVYASGGDLFAGDITTKESRLVLGGPERDSAPLFSPDGQRLAFLRATSTAAYDLLVVGIDGRNSTKVSTTPLAAGSTFQWAPDSRGVFVAYTTGDLVRFDAGAGPPVVVAHDVDVDSHAFRPPDGRQILFQTHGDASTLLVMNADGTGAHSIAPVGDHGNINQARWSPDGSRIAIGRKLDDPVQLRLFIVNADGSGLRQLTNDRREWFETDPVWSPDGTRVAFNRWLHGTATDQWWIQPIGIVTIATGAFMEAGAAPVSEGSLFDWSPDGRSLIGLPGPHAAYGETASNQPTVIDVATGREAPLAWKVESAVSWQRVAP